MPRYRTKYNKSKDEEENLDEEVEETEDHLEKENRRINQSRNRHGRPRTTEHYKKQRENTQSYYGYYPQNQRTSFSISHLQQKKVGLGFRGNEGGLFSKSSSIGDSMFRNSNTYAKGGGLGSMFGAGNKSKSGSIFGSSKKGKGLDHMFGF